MHGWTWSELGGATVEGQVLVPWSRDEHQLARIAFPATGPLHVGRTEYSSEEPDEARAIILDRLRQHETTS